MKRQIVGVVIWAVVYAASLAANLGSFWMGDGAALHQMGLTVLYGVACLTFLWTARNGRRWMKAFLFWGIASVMAGVFCLMARAGIAWSAIPALILGGALFTPFYGLTYLALLEDWDVFYGLMLGQGIIWTIVSARLWQRLKERNHDTGNR